VLNYNKKRLAINYFLTQNVNSATHWHKYYPEMITAIVRRRPLRIHSLHSSHQNQFMKHFSIKLALLVTTSLLLAGSANASVIDFSNVATKLAPNAPYLSTNDMLLQGNFSIQAEDSNYAVRPVARLSNGDDPASCLNGVCPGGNNSDFLSVFGDGIIHIRSLTGDTLVFGGLSAAYIPPIDAAAQSTLYLAIEADRTDGSYASFYYPLLSSGDFTQISSTGGVKNGGSGSLTDGAVSDLYIYGIFCDGGTGSCSAFNTGQAQFALDNITFATAADQNQPVPEPMSIWLAAAAISALLIARRRAQSA